MVGQIMRIIFFGTQRWSAKLLESVDDDDFFEVVGVVTQPASTPSPVKIAALSRGIAVLEHTQLKDASFVDQIKALKPDMALVIAYGKIIPKEILDLVPKGFINVHPSLLPRWRGPSPVQAAIANGDTISGLSIMKIDDQMDHGPILAQREIFIAEDETVETFMEKVLAISRSLLVSSLKLYATDSLPLVDQQHEKATVCKLLNRDDGCIDWTKSASEIERMTRAYDPWPGAWTKFLHRSKLIRLKILKTRVEKEISPTIKHRTIFSVDKRLFVMTGLHVLELLIVQPEGKVPMQAPAFLSGYAGSLPQQLDEVENQNPEEK